APASCVIASDFAIMSPSMLTLLRCAKVYRLNDLYGWRFLRAVYLCRRPAADYYCIIILPTGK
ncbi:MAG: hypothetical protein ACJ8HI_18320, partial [Massilia sp.]